MIVQKNHVVVLTYDLKTDQGDLVDQATAESPFAFIHGIGSTLPAFDQALEGKSPGDAFEFSIDHEQGYGTYDDTKIQEIPRNVFAEAPEGTLVVGNTLPLQYDDPSDPRGPQTIFGTITELKEEGVVLDFNHPLAGQNLNFSGQILEVREATKSELDHGHVHGPDGVQH